MTVAGTAPAPQPAPDPPPGGGRRREIAAVAARLFYEQGYDAVGMRAVAAAVGIRVASLYHHFPSKSLLLDEIVTDVSTAFIETRLPALLDPGRPVAPRIRSLLVDHIGYFWEHRIERTVGVRDLQRLPPARAEAVQEARRRYQRALGEVIAEGVADGSLRTADPFLAATAALAVVNGVNDWYKPGGLRSLEEVAHATVELVVEGILGAAPAGSG